MRALRSYQTRILFLFLLITFTLEPLNAHPTCESIFIDATARRAMYIDRYSKIVSFAEMLNASSGILKIEPPRITISTDEVMAHLDSLAMHGQIKIGIGGDHPLTIYLAAFTHEFGHLIFNKYVKLEYFGEVTSALRLHGHGTSISLERSMRLHHLTAPFEELFADLLTALVFNDPKIIHKAVSIGTVLRESDRDFSELEIAKEKSQIAYAELTRSLRLLDPYTDLDIARRKLWKLIRSRVEIGMPIDQTLKIVLNCMESQIRSYIPLLEVPTVAGEEIIVSPLQLSLDLVKRVTEDLH